MMSDPPTIHDVARAAGVSPATVSRALNGYPRMADGTREAVKTAVRELGYSRLRQTSTAGTERDRLMAEIAPLRALARWLVSLDAPANRQGRRVVTLPLIIKRARKALGEK